MGESISPPRTKTGAISVGVREEHTIDGVNALIAELPKCPAAGLRPSVDGDGRQHGRGS